MSRSGSLRLIAATAVAISARSAVATLVQWDSSGNTPSNPTDGPGTWDTTSKNWSSFGSKVAWSNSAGYSAGFGNNHGSAGLVTVAVPVTSAAVNFVPASSGDYTLAGPGPLTCGSFSAAAGTSPTVSCPIAGSRFSFSGPGTLTLGGVSQYTGGTTVYSGTLILAPGGTLGTGFLNLSTGSGTTLVQLNESVTATGPIYESGNLTIGAGKALDVGAYGFNHASGVLTVDGSLNLSGGTFTLSGGTATGAVNLTGTASLTIAATTATGSFAFTGPAVAATVNGSYQNIPAGTVVTAAASAGNTNLTVKTDGGYGSITVTATDGYTAGLNLSTGSFNNRGTITLNAVGTPSAPTTIYKSFNNAAGGVVNLDTPTALAASVYNAGTFNVPAGSSLDLKSYTLNQSGGVLNAAGPLSIAGGTVVDNGGTINGPVPLNGSGTLSFGVNAKPGTFNFSGPSVSATLADGNVPAGAVVNVGSTTGNTTLTIKQSGMYGAVTVTSADGYNASLGQYSGLISYGSVTFNARGTPSSTAYTGGFNNTAGGTVNLNTGVTIGYTNMVNAGTFNVAAGGLADVRGTTFNQTGGALNINGAFNVSGGTFDDFGGSINGAVNLVGTGNTLNLGPNGPAATFNFTGPSVNGVIQGLILGNGANIPSGAVVTAAATTSDTYLSVSALGNYGSITATSAPGRTGTLLMNAPNHGSVRVASTGTPSAPFNVGSVVNGADGTVSFDTAVKLSGDFNNTGTVDVAAAASVDLNDYAFNQTAGVLNAAGPINVGAGKFVMTGGTLNAAAGVTVGHAVFNDSGGTINGVVTLNPGASLFLGSAAAAGQFDFTGASISGEIDGNGTVAAGSVVNVNSSTPSASFYLSVGSNYGTISCSSTDAAQLHLGGYISVNHGTIIVSSTGPATGATFLPVSTNAADGVIRLNTATQIGGILNAGRIIVAPGATADAKPSINLSGGSIHLSSDASVPARLTAALIDVPYDPTPGTPVIDTDPTGLPGVVDFGTGNATVEIDNAKSTLTISAATTGGTLTKTGSGTLVLAGQNTFTTALQVSYGSLTLGAGSTVQAPFIDVGPAGTLVLPGVASPVPLHLVGRVVYSPVGVTGVGPINVPAGATVAYGPSQSTSVLVTPSVQLTGFPGYCQSRLDLTNNALDVTAGDLATLTDQVRPGFASSVGIWSSTAAADTSRSTAVGVISNNQSGSALFTADRPFIGAVPGLNDVLIRYTYYGDANLDGVVDGSDYALIDAGILTGGTGWYAGDFNYDRVVDGSDYTLIDNAYNRQTTTPAKATAIATSLVATPAAVPEPAAMALLPAAVAGLLARRRSRPVDQS